MRLVFVLAILLLIQGCATAPMATADKDIKAKSFETKPSTASLYVYRNENFGGAISMDVLINNLLVGQTAAKTYFKFDLIPGKYQIQSKSENVSLLDLTLEAGRNYFVWQEVKMGILYARTKLSLKSDDEGIKGVLESRLIDSVVSSQDILPNNVTSVQQNQGQASIKLNELKMMFEKGEISQTEYDLARTKILKEF